MQGWQVIGITEAQRLKDHEIDESSFGSYFVGVTKVLFFGGKQDESVKHKKRFHDPYESLIFRL